MQPPQQRPPAARMNQESITHCGWTVTARKAPIIGSSLLDEYSAKLGGVLTLPEILFGNSGLQLQHTPSGVTLSFSAFEALQQWKTDNLPPLKVAVAGEWQAARQQEIAQQQAVVLAYDWTYTTSYCGSVHIRAAESDTQNMASGTPLQCGGATGVSADAGMQHTAGSESQSTAPAQAASAAVTTTATSQLDAANNSSTIPAQGQLVDDGCTKQQQQPVQCHWQPTQHQIDRQMLMSKQEPILFYAEVPLYESELDDNGVCQLVVKVRLMPRCWLVLLRLWLRVDGALVRLREVRHFCRLDTPNPVIIRETKWSEGTMQELTAAGGPSTTSDYEDADAATAVFNAIAPQCLKKFELHELRLPPSAVDKQ